MKWIFKTISFSLVLALLIGGIALAFPIGMASAATLADTTPPPTPEKQSLHQAKNSHPGMERAYNKLELIMERQAKILVSGEKIGKVEEIISKLKSNGKDTSVLEAALAQFKTDVIEAGKVHEKAAGLLTTHAGFDPNGIVVDAVQAKQTLVSARDNLKGFRAILKDSLGEFRKAITDFRKNNQARNPKS